VKVKNREHPAMGRVMEAFAQSTAATQQTACGLRGLPKIAEVHQNRILLAENANGNSHHQLVA